MSLPTDKFKKGITQKEMDMSKNLIDNIFGGKSPDPVSESLRTCTQEEKNEISESMNAAAKITGLYESEESSFKDKLLNESGSLTEQTLSVIESSPKKIPQKHINQALAASKKIKQMESFLLKFIQKYQ